MLESGKSAGFAKQDLPAVWIRYHADLVKRVDFEQIDYPKCGAQFQPAERERN
jgi:hypothetical protein